MANYDLKTALQKLGQKRQNFALYRGEEGDQIFISSRPPSPKQLAEIENETGEGKRMLKGVCFREEIGLVFATRNAAAPAWEKMLGKVLKDRKCGQFLPLTLRQLSSNESEEASDNDAEPGAVPAAGKKDQAEWEQFKSFLMPHLRSAIADPATREKVTKVVLVAQASEKAGAYGDAIAIFQRLASVLQIPTVSPAPIIAPAVPIRPPKAGKLQAALNKLSPVFQRAVAARPERKAEILRPVLLFQQQLKAGELEEARETLRQASRLLQSVLSAAA